jgi:hypothetical protein
MEENEAKGLDERTLVMNKFIGISLVFVGLYGIYYAVKIYKGK